MFYKRCTICGTRLEYNTICSCKREQKTNSDDYKNDKQKQFYKSKKWQNAVKIAKNKFNYLDIYSYYKLGIIEKGQVVHHIIPLDEDFNKRLNLDNMIFLTEKNHRTLHNLMKKDEESKKDVQKMLFSLIKQYEQEFKGVGGANKI